MMDKFLLVAAAAFSVCAGRLDAKQPRSARKPDLTVLSTDDLIGRFQALSKQSVGADSVAMAVGFVALNEPLKFGGGILGTPQPEVSPVMRELVRRGMAAVPALLDHLSDARRTKLILVKAFGDSSFGATWFGNEYDPKDSAVTKLAPGLNLVGKSDLNFDDPSQSASGNESDKDGYHAKVGDLCFVTLGQIVNRQLVVARYQPTACLVLSSPVRTPALAAAARADWSDLTKASFEASLTRDVTGPSEGVSSLGALQRMLFYYPEDGQVLASTLLDQPLYSDSIVAKLFLKLVDAGEQEQDRLLTDFRTEYGDAQFQAVVQRLMKVSQEPPLEPELPKDLHELGLKQTAAAAKLIERRFADADKHLPLNRQPVFCIYQKEVVDALAGSPSPIIDRAARDLLKRTLVLKTSVDDRVYQCRLAAACAKRFVALARRKALDRATERLGRHVPPDDASEKVVAVYVRECDAFLRTLTEDPALGLSTVRP